MAQILPFASTTLDLLLVVVGFGLIIVIHELGHFLAARWAGIRVFAFAVGFGPALLSYRRGMGWHRGSSERAYRAMLADRGLGIHDLPPADVSPTEYRLNWLPFGGYVKMLGQEDANPGATSHAADSYQTCHPAKRLVVISAGVVANVILAAFLFIFVFMVGLRTEPPRLGVIASDGPAATAQSVDASVNPGLRPGDDVLRIDGREARSFNDLMLASAMSRPGTPIEVLVRRDGHNGPLAFEIMPRTSDATGLRDIGVAPAQSVQLYDDGGDLEGYQRVMGMIGLGEVPPAATLRSARVGDGPARDIDDPGLLAEVFTTSGGEPVTLSFAKDGVTHEATLRPRPRLQEALVPMPSGTTTPQTHLLGLTPVMTVGPLDEAARGYVQGLRAGDVFARLGSLEFPSVSAGIAEIRRNAGESMPVVVLRGGEPVELAVSVNREGQIGFFPDQDLDGTLLSLPPLGADLGESVIDRPGLRVVAVGGLAVSNFADIRSAMLDATGEAHAAGTGARVVLDVRLPNALGIGGEARSRTLDLTVGEVASLHDLGHGAPPGLLSVFRPAEFTLKAEGPVDAVRVGLAETHRVMMMTYLTFARLVQGSVKVEHLKGPVGIAHLGTRVADRGIIWLLFFMALISVNLAVVNFLPLPIVDGGQFLFILFEWIRGKPVPEAVQSIATVAGLLLIGAAFLVVTFNDIRNVFVGL